MLSWKENYFYQILIHVYIECKETLLLAYIASK